MQQQTVNQMVRGRRLLVLGDSISSAEIGYFSEVVRELGPGVAAQQVSTLLSGECGTSIGVLSYLSEERAQARETGGRDLIGGHVLLSSSGVLSYRGCGAHASSCRPSCHPCT